MERGELVEELGDVASALESLSRMIRAETAICCSGAETDCLNGIAAIHKALAGQLTRITERLDEGELIEK
jgi:hypothetical protein